MCNHPACPVEKAHCCGRIQIGSKNVPKIINNSLDRVAKNRATDDDYQLLEGYNAVHNPGSNKIEDEDASSVDVEIIC